MKRWIESVIAAAVNRRLLSLEQQITGQVDATREKLMGNVAVFDRQITDHLARLEDDVIRMLHRCDKDSILHHERDALIRAAFRRAN